MSNRPLIWAFTIGQFRAVRPCLILGWIGRTITKLYIVLILPTLNFAASALLNYWTEKSKHKARIADCSLEILDFLQENHKNVQSGPGSARGVQKEDTSDLNGLKNLKTI
jgi:hypothetical protein